MSLSDFFIPSIGSGLMRSLYVVLNITFIFGGVALAAYFYAYFKGRKDNDSFTAVKKHDIVKGSVYSSLATAGLIGLSIFASMDLEGSIYDLFQIILDILDPVLDIRRLADNPIEDFFGINLIGRVVIICTLLMAVLWARKLAKRTAYHFSRFLEQKVIADSAEASAGGATAESQDTSAAPETPDSEWKNLQKLFSKIWKILAPSSGIGLLAFIFGTDDVREGISEVLETVADLLKTATLLSEVNPNITGVSAFFSNFLFVILSIFILAVYAAIAMMLAVFLQAIVKNWTKIVQWVEEKKRVIWISIGVIILVIATCAAVIAIGYGFQDNRILSIAFQGGPLGCLKVVANFALLFLSICVIFLLLAVVISFVALTAAYAIQVVKRMAEKWAVSEDTSAFWKIAKVFLWCIVASILLLAVALGYNTIRDRMYEIFYPNGKFDIGPLKVLMLLSALLVALEGGLAVISIAVLLALIIASSAATFFKDKRGTIAERISKLIGNTLARVIDVFSLLPFLVKHSCNVLKTVLSTILQIFIGYRNESEKNSAIFVAACFASLASLLNTFFGLKGFYNASGSFTLTVCSFAIACAVQLAMLIFGMKAGEGIAEWIIMRRGNNNSGLTRTIISRVFFLLVLLLFDIPLILIAVWTLTSEKNSTADIFSYLPLILVFLAVLALTYAIILQVIAICSLWKKKKHGCLKSADNAGTSVDLLVPHSPRRIPFYCYLAAYLFLMVVSTGFAFNNMFGFYANSARIHERVYDQVRYQTDARLHPSQTVADLVDEYIENTNLIMDKFSKRAADAITVRENKIAAYRKLAEQEPTGIYIEANNRDRFIGQTREFEEIVSTIKSFIQMDYEDVGSNVLIVVEEYAHYWGGQGQPSYQSTCFIIYLNGDKPDEENAMVVGSRVDSAKMIKSVRVTDGSGVHIVAFPSARLADPDHTSQSIIQTSRKVSGADKYSILKELISQYERLENRIYDYTREGKEGDDVDPSSSAPSKSLTKPEESMGSQINGLLDKNAKLDGIRANIANLYRSSANKSDLSATPSAAKSQAEPISIRDLPWIVDAYLNTDDNLSAASEGGVDGGQTPDSRALNGDETAVPPEEETVEPEYVDAYLNTDDNLSAASEGGVDGGQTPDSRALNGDETAVPPEEETVEPEYYVDDSYQSLSGYIDRALSLNNILAGFNTGGDSSGVSQENTDVPATASPGTEGQEENPSTNDAFWVRTYRNYAQGITYSNFQISYDALLSGGLNLNLVKDEIDALYASSTVAKFILFICLIVDFLAFFSGLLLFKDIYLFSREKKINEIGYLNYETALTNLFSVPTESPDRILRLTAIYTILYGNASDCANKVNDSTDENRADSGDSGAAAKSTAGPGQAEKNHISSEQVGTPSADAPGSTNQGGNASDGSSSVAAEDPSCSEPEKEKSSEHYIPNARLYDITQSNDFKEFYSKVDSILKQLNLDENHTDLQLWLRSFVEKNEIHFDELLSQKKEQG